MRHADALVVERRGLDNVLFRGSLNGVVNERRALVTRLRRMRPSSHGRSICGVDDSDACQSICLLSTGLGYFVFAEAFGDGSPQPPGYNLSSPLCICIVSNTIQYTSLRYRIGCIVSVSASAALPLRTFTPASSDVLGFSAQSFSR